MSDNRTEDPVRLDQLVFNGSNVVMEIICTTPDAIVAAQKIVATVAPAANKGQSPSL